MYAPVQESWTVDMLGKPLATPTNEIPFRLIPIIMTVTPDNNARMRKKKTAKPRSRRLRSAAPTKIPG